MVASLGMTNLEEEKSKLRGQSCVYEIIIIINKQKFKYYIVLVFVYHTLTWCQFETEMFLLCSLPLAILLSISPRPNF